MSLLRDLARATRRFLRPPRLEEELADERLFEADLEGELDPDLHVLTDYFAGELPPEEQAAVEGRLRTDGKFARKAEPLRLFWGMPVERKPMPREELLGHWLEFRRRVGLPPIEGPFDPNGPLPTTPMDVAAPLPKGAMADLEPEPFRNGRALAKPRSGTRGRGWLAAAALVAAVAVPTLYLWSRGDSALPSGVTTGQSTIALSDGSRVYLEAGTTLEPVPGFSRRRFTLAGEATFTVAPRPGEPFEVRTHSAIVVVTGTVFTVHAYPGEPYTDVTVQEGSVVVTKRAGGLRMTLSAGDRGRF